jgi:hypothetical protein
MSLQFTPHTEKISGAATLMNRPAFANNELRFSPPRCIFMHEPRSSGIRRRLFPSPSLPNPVVPSERSPRLVSNAVEGPVVALAFAFCLFSFCHSAPERSRRGRIPRPEGHGFSYAKNESRKAAIALPKDRSEVRRTKRPQIAFFQNRRETSSFPPSLTTFFFKNSPKIACQVPKPSNSHKIRYISSEV